MRTIDARTEAMLEGITLCRHNTSENEFTKLLNAVWKRKSHYSKRYHNRFRQFEGCSHTSFNRANASLWDKCLKQEPGIDKFLAALYDAIPSFLRSACEFAAFCDSEIFPDALPQPQLKELVGSTSYLDPNETPLSRFCRLSGMSSTLVMRRLVEMGQSPECFLDALLNLKNGGMLLAVDHLARQRSSFSFIGATIPKSERRRVLTHILAACGWDLTHNTRVTRYPPQRALQFYGPGKCIEDFGYMGVMGKYSHFLSLKIPSKSQLMMLLLSFYFIVCRILTDTPPTVKAFSLRGIPDEPSYAAAGACYIAMRRLTSALDFSQWSTQDPFEVFPDFPSFIELLKLVLRGSATLVGCCDCHTPYVIFDDKLRVKDHPDLIRTRCPRCSCDREYDQEAGSTTRTIASQK
ncbi:MAG: hypothetical protein PUA61_10095 [Succinatimonas hippei]|nr:hypothetical protein [Succinatimonas hippei]